jgi:endonuclease/exonuclease/phosphatase (EEP) superfamily protein YafD
MLNKNLINEKVSASGLTKIFALLVGVLSVATVFDDFHRYLELFAHFKLQYLVASIIFSGVFFALREYQLGWVMIIVTTLNLNYVLPWYFSSKPVSAIDFAAEIKLVHANVHTSNTNYQALIDLVNKESPDILIAQEVNKQWIIALNKIEDILPYKQVRAREDNFGIAVYSKYPFDKSEVIYFEASQVPSIKISFTVARQRVSLITSHPLPPVNTNYYESRNSQIKEISLESKEIKNPLIIVGDLNVTMWSKDYQPLEEYANLSNTRKGFGLLPTWPTNLLPLMIPIDHCLVSSDFETIDMKVSKNIGSDHLPLVITLGLHI